MGTVSHDPHQNHGGGLAPWLGKTSEACTSGPAPPHTTLHPLVSLILFSVHLPRTHTVKVLLHTPATHRTVEKAHTQHKHTRLQRNLTHALHSPPATPATQKALAHLRGHLLAKGGWWTMWSPWAAPPQSISPPHAPGSLPTAAHCGDTACALCSPSHTPCTFALDGEGGPILWPYQQTPTAWTTTTHIWMVNEHVHTCLPSRKRHPARAAPAPQAARDPGLQGLENTHPAPHTTPPPHPSLPCPHIHSCSNVCWRLRIPPGRMDHYALCTNTGPSTLIYPQHEKARRLYTRVSLGRHSKVSYCPPFSAMVSMPLPGFVTTRRGYARARLRHPHYH